MQKNKNTSITLGKHFDGFISAKIKEGRFNSVSEAVRAGLRLLEENESKLEALRSHLAKGEAQLENGEFVAINSPEEAKELFKSLISEFELRLEKENG